MKTRPTTTTGTLKKGDTSTEGVWTSSTPNATGSKPRRFLQDEEDKSVYWCLSTFTLFDADDIETLRRGGVDCEIVDGAKV